MPYRIAGIDVHKKMLAVVVADVEIDGDFQFDRQKVGTTPADLRGLAEWLVAEEVEVVVLESTAPSPTPAGARPRRSSVCEQMSADAPSSGGTVDAPIVRSFLPEPGRREWVSYAEKCGLPIRTTDAVPTTSALSHLEREGRHEDETAVADRGACPAVRVVAQRLSRYDQG
jgi:hypothetical protein